jgi:hypothetical protein
LDAVAEALGVSVAAERRGLPQPGFSSSLRHGGGPATTATIIPVVHAESQRVQNIALAGASKVVAGNRRIPPAPIFTAVTADQYRIARIGRHFVENASKRCSRIAVGKLSIPPPRIFAV